MLLYSVKSNARSTYRLIKIMWTQEKSKRKKWPIGYKTSFQNKKKRLKKIVV